jgi:hypothetical protein
LKRKKKKKPKKQNKKKKKKTTTAKKEQEKQLAAIPNKEYLPESWRWLQIAIQTFLIKPYLW